MNALVATAGHVDHGKSTLVEALTGTHPDRWAEERRRGLTIDLGFAHGTLPDGAELSIIDVPGHQRFLGNMLAGVGAVDAVLFVVAANEGWKPQSEEHLRIVELLGIRAGVVAVTKTDLMADEGAATISAVRQRLAGSTLADAPIVGLSAPRGAGLVELQGALGEMLGRVRPAADGHRPRLWVDRAFTVKGAGTVVTGTLLGGALQRGDELQVIPAGHTVRIRGLQRHGIDLPTLGPGGRAALNLTGDGGDLRRGDALLRAAQWRPTTTFDAELTVLAGADRPVSQRGAYRLFVGTAALISRVRILGTEAIGPGQSGVVRVYLRRPLALLPGDRFVLRDTGRDETVGGGEVLDVAPVRRASVARPDRDVDRLIDERGAVEAAELEALSGERRTPTVGRWVVADNHLEALRRRLGAAVDQAGPLGLDLAALGELERAVTVTLPGVRVDHGRAIGATVDVLADHPAIAATRAGWWSPEPPPADRATLRQLVVRGLLVEQAGLYFHPAALDAAGAVAGELLRGHPDGFTVSELRHSLGTSRKFAVPLAELLDRQGMTVRVGDARRAGPAMPR